MRMKTDRTARKVKAAALAAFGTSVASAAGLKLAMPEIPDEVSISLISLVTAILTWLLGYRTKPDSQDQIIPD